jgi:hypothetical protein
MQFLYKLRIPIRPILKLCTHTSLSPPSVFFLTYLLGLYVSFQVLTAASIKNFCLSSGLLHRVAWWKFTDVSDVLAASIVRTI